MKLIVTGGVGFVGSHLVDALVERGDEVLVIDDMSNGYEENKNPKAEYVEASVGVLPEYEFLFKEGKVDLVYHLACFPRSMSFAKPFTDLVVNYEGTLELCELAKEYKFGVVFSSNSGLLGPPIYLPYDEKHPPHPLTPYDNHKLASEHLLRLYSDNYGVRSYIFRFASVYGPRQRPNAALGWLPLIPTWIKALISNEPVTVEGDGQQTRDFIYVADVVKALVKAGDVLGWANGCVGPYLLASGVETKIKDLLEWLRVLIPSEIKILDAPARLGDIRRMAYDTNNVRLALNWDADTTLENGLSKTVEWWKQM